MLIVRNQSINDLDVFPIMVETANSSTRHEKLWKYSKEDETILLRSWQFAIFFNNPYITIRDTVVVTELHVLTAWYTLRKKHTSLAKVHLSTLPFTIHRKCLNWLHSSTTNGHSHSTHHVSVKYKLWHTFDPPLQVQISSYQIKPILENFHLQIMGLNWYQVKPNQT